MNVSYSVFTASTAGKAPTTTIPGIACPYFFALFEKMLLLIEEKEQTNYASLRINRRDNQKRAAASSGSK